METKREGIAASKGNYVLTVDGSGSGSLSNPAPGAIGAVLRNPRGAIVATLSQAIGPATNTVAEYTALIEGLTFARSLGIDRIRVFLDSELVVDQLRGTAAVRKEHVRPLNEQASALLAEFSNTRIAWIPRSWNKEADALATGALLEARRETALPDAQEKARRPTPTPPEIDVEGQIAWISEQTGFRAT